VLGLLEPTQPVCFLWSLTECFLDQGFGSGTWYFLRKARFRLLGVRAGFGQFRCFLLLLGSVVGIGLGSFLVLFVMVLYPFFS
jgi:hypothetical protein